MFESMMANVVKPAKIIWRDPSHLEITTKGEEKADVYNLLKGAKAYLHKQVDIKPATSDELFKKAEDIWKQFRDVQINKVSSNTDNPQYFALDKSSVVYVSNDHNDLIDICDLRNEETYNEFLSQLDKFKIDVTTTEKTKKFYTDGRGGIVKLVCYDKDADLPHSEYTPVVLIEFNTAKSEYVVYTGILLYDTFTFIPNLSAYMSFGSYIDLIRNLDIDSALENAQERASELYEGYKSFSQNAYEVSAREVISILKRVGYKLVLRDDQSLDLIENMIDDEGNNKIQTFFNTFKFTTGESAYDILALSELKKVFRYNKLTLIDMLAILSKEYLTYEGSKITADVLSQMVFNLFDKQNDKRQAESIKQEISE